MNGLDGKDCPESCDKETNHWGVTSDLHREEYNEHEYAVAEEHVSQVEEKALYVSLKTETECDWSGWVG